VRHTRRRGTAAAVLTLPVCALLLAAVLPADAALAAPPGTAPVQYHGVRLRVPASWPVIDLARHPGTCARVDRHAVYLGTPAEDADCPPGIAGRTETVSLRPAGAGQVAPAATALPRSVPESPSRGASWTLAPAGVTLTVTYGTAPRQVDTILAGARYTSGARPGTTAPAEATQKAWTTVPGDVTARGFDACQAPTSATMDDWRSGSVYRAIGVYIGGGDLGCPDQPNLSASWVHRQAGRGWHIFPLYVGRQAPCSNQSYKITKGRAASQGTADAGDAIARARGYGMAKGTIIVNDMEYYDRGGACSTAVLNYLSAWTVKLNNNGYRSGVYSSRSAAIDDLVAARPSGRYRMPGTIDFAQWDNEATTQDDRIPANYWVHHRLKQYKGAHNEKHGGVKINIDSDYLDVS
jgi:hypothetical protein